MFRALTLLFFVHQSAMVMVCLIHGHALSSRLHLWAKGGRQLLSIPLMSLGGEALALFEESSS
jgi:hypothetical protein